MVFGVTVAIGFAVKQYVIPVILDSVLGKAADPYARVEL
jgi:hypothetical protein